MNTKTLFSIAVLSSVVALTACNDKAETEVVEPQAAVEAAVETVEVEVIAEEVANTDKPYMSATVADVTTSTVTAIDQQTRAVTLQGEDGNVVTFIADENVRNLAQVSVGDIVTVETVQNLTVEVFSAPNAVPAEGELVAETRAKLGEMPAAAIVDTKVEVSTVEAIDLEANTFRLKDVTGTVTEYIARDPENLKNAAVGDVVVATLTEAMAISVAKKEATDEQAAN